MSPSLFRNGHLEVKMGEDRSMFHGSGLSSDGQHITSGFCRGLWDAFSAVSLQNSRFFLIYVAIDCNSPWYL